MKTDRGLAPAANGTVGTVGQYQLMELIGRGTYGYEDTVVRFGKFGGLGCPGGFRSADGPSFVVSADLCLTPTE